MTKTQTEPATIKCHNCDSEVAFDDSLGAEVGKRGKWGDVCRECYDEIVHTCQICGEEDVMPSDVSEYILVKEEFAPEPKPPGIYRIISRPFMSIPLIGSGHLHGNDVLFVDHLPKPDREYEISGHICKKCAAPYQATYKRAYAVRPKLAHLMKPYTGATGSEGKWWCVLRFTKPGWKIQREHIRSVILSNTEMLRDLEDDPNGYRWKEMKEAFQLPNLVTYHPLLFLEHGGVKVYRCYEDSSGWLTLRPEPKYRNPHRSTPLIFAASGLPTWHREGEYRYEHPKEDREAVIKAIDAGLLTQSGVKNDKGEIVYCH